MNVLARLRNAINITQEELANLSGLSKSLIAQMETEQKAITKKSAEKLAPILKCSPVDLVFSGNAQQSLEMNAIVSQTPINIPAAAEMTTDLPVYGTVECGDGDYMEFTDTFMIKRPPIWSGRDDVYAVKASGESMTPRFFPGETVYVDTKLKPRHGCDVVVQLHDGRGGIQRAMLKVYMKKTPSIYVFSSYNPDYEQSIEIAVEKVKSVDVVVPAGELIGG